MTRAGGKLSRRAAARINLSEEVAYRVQVMIDTGDITDWQDRYQTALEDIVDLTAEEHGAYTAEEVSIWNDIRQAARAALKVFLKTYKRS